MEKCEISIDADDDEALMKQLYLWHLKMIEYHNGLTAEHLERAKYFHKMVRDAATAALTGKDQSAG